MSDDRHFGFGVELRNQEWRTLAPGLREKAHTIRGQRYRIVEFRSEFYERDWCLRGHAGYVLRGEITVNVDGVEVSYREGDAVDLPAGTPHRHLKTVEVAELLLIETEE